MSFIMKPAQGYYDNEDAIVLSYALIGEKERRFAR